MCLPCGPIQLNKRSIADMSQSAVDTVLWLFIFTGGVKMPYIHFTDEQKRQANEVDLVEFLRSK